MFTITRTLYNETMKYLTAVPYDDRELWELCEGRPAMPKEVINAMEDDEYYEWAQCQLDVIRAKRKVAEMQIELDKKNKELINVEKNIKFSNQLDLENKMIVRKYITKGELHDGDVKTQLALSYGNIPPETEVTFIEEWTNFYGNWVRVKYKDRIYDVRPFDIFIREITKDELTEPNPNCCTMFKNSEVTLIGKLSVTDNCNNIIESDIWLSKNSDGDIIPVDIKMCKSFYFISSVVDKPFKFNNDLNCRW